VWAKYRKDSRTTGRMTCFALRQLRYMLGEGGRSYVVGVRALPPPPLLPLLLRRGRMDAALHAARCTLHAARCTLPCAPPPPKQKKAHSGPSWRVPLGPPAPPPRELLPGVAAEEHAPPPARAQVGSDPPCRPHHRGASCPLPPTVCDCGHAETSACNPNTITGALVGGPGKSDNFTDSRPNYQQNEVAIDYNAGFSGALAGLAESSWTWPQCMSSGYANAAAGRQAGALLAALAALVALLLAA
jgi:hypothetical protein